MSVEPERVFSGYDTNWGRSDDRCKLTLTEIRNRMKTDAVDPVECLRGWLGVGFVESISQSTSSEMRVV